MKEREWEAWKKETQERGIYCKAMPQTKNGQGIQPIFIMGETKQEKFGEWVMRGCKRGFKKLKETMKKATGRKKDE